MSILLGNPDVAFVTDSGGTFSLAPGIPITDATVLSVTLSAGLVTDTDSFFAPAVTPIQLLLPALLADTDTFYASSVTAGAVTLAPALFSDADVFYTATVTPGAIVLAPVAFSDTDAFFAPNIASGVVTLLPALLSDNDSVFAPSLAIIAPLALAPALLVDADGVPAANVGWNLVPYIVVDDDAGLGGGVQATAWLLPNVFMEEDVIDFYPFFIQALIGGVPVPPSPDTMTGSIVGATLTGGFTRSPTLTGSITGTARRQSRRKAA